VLRAADLIVRAGGFGVVALDLADLSRHGAARDAVMAGWGMRTKGATRCSLLADARLRRSPRGWSVRLTARARWGGDSAQRRRFEGLDVTAEVTSARQIGHAEIRL
jgi:hypothetical protein